MEEAINHLKSLKDQADADMVDIQERINAAQAVADTLPGLMEEWGQINNRISCYDGAISALEAYVAPAPEPETPEEELTEFTEQPDPGN